MAKMVKLPLSCRTRLRNFLPAGCFHLGHYLNDIKSRVDMYVNGCIFQMRFYCFYSDVVVLGIFTTILI